MPIGYQLAAPPRNIHKLRPMSRVVVGKSLKPMAGEREVGGRMESCQLIGSRQGDDDHGAWAWHLAGYVARSAEFI
jgi:hypothetical protein